MSGLLTGLKDPSRQSGISLPRIALLVAVPLAAILFQVYIPRFFTRLSYLELPLLVTIYFGLMSRSPISGLFFE